MQFTRQNAVLRQGRTVDFAQGRRRAFDLLHRCRFERQREQPAAALPFDFGFGETGRAAQTGHAVVAEYGAGVGEGREREVGRQQCLHEEVEGRCHDDDYSVLMLMEPMLSMASSSAAEALKLMPRKGGMASGPFDSRIASSNTRGISDEHS